MKKLVLFIFFNCFVLMSIACDVCGYGNAINAMSLLPQFSQSYLGLRYSNQSFTTTHPDDNDQEADRFLQFDLIGRHVFSKRLQWSFSFPYAVNQQIGSDDIHSKGFGDLSSFITYTVFPSKQIGKTPFYHALQVIAGIKTPTGKYKSDFSVSTFNEHLYPGTGSWDFMPALNYVINKNRFGLNIDFNAKFNTANKISYKMGNQRSSNLKFFYTTAKPMFNFIPFIALGYLANQVDINTAKEVSFTGGYEWNAQYGADLKIKNLLFGFQYLKPFNQNWNDGFSCHEGKFSVRLFYLF
jgi:hypothetical protein